MQCIDAGDAEDVVLKCDVQEGLINPGLTPFQNQFVSPTHCHFTCRYTTFLLS